MGPTIDVAVLETFEPSGAAELDGQPDAQLAASHSSGLAPQTATGPDLDVRPLQRLWSSIPRYPAKTFKSALLTATLLGRGASGGKSSAGGATGAAGGARSDGGSAAIVTGGVGGTSTPPSPTARRHPTFPSSKTARTVCAGFLLVDGTCAIREELPSVDPAAACDGPDLFWTILGDCTYCSTPDVTVTIGNQGSSRAQGTLEVATPSATVQTLELDLDPGAFTAPLTVHEHDFELVFDGDCNPENDMLKFWACTVP